MGAASGSQALIANVIRVSLRYENLDTLEDAYGINMMPLATFAMKTYADDPCSVFETKAEKPGKDNELFKKMHKAIAMIQFKLESQIVLEKPSI